MADNNQEKIGLLKDIYNHIIYQYELADRANESLTDKAMRMAGFCGVILGLLVNIVINKIGTFSCLAVSEIIITAVFIFISILFYLSVAFVRTSQSLINPTDLLNNFRDNIPKENFWNEFPKAAQEAYDDIKKINSIKSIYAKFGDVFFILGMFFMTFFFVCYLICK